ncbi:uncharacterized protein LOC120326473 [Styela clava]
MREDYTCFQLIGNDSSIKRMVASVYLNNAKKQEQTIRVCICDDLPHIVRECDESNRIDTARELLQADLSVSVNYERTLTVIASEITTTDEQICSIEPNYEVVIPPETIWAHGATVIVDFQVHMLKSNENASVQISIMSQDDGGNEIPLSVPPRAHLLWQPKNLAGVTKLREAWEVTGESEIQRKTWTTRQGPKPFTSNYNSLGHKSVTMPRHMQPNYAKVDTLVQRKMTRMQEVEAELKREEQKMKWEEERKRRADERKDSAMSSSHSDKYHIGSGSSASSIQDTDWNVIKDPRATIPTINGAYDSNGEPLPEWAKGLGEDFNYDDVVVV